MKLNAVTFRNGLLGAIALLILATGAGFYLLSGMLRAKAIEVNRAQIDAELSSNETIRLQKLQSELDRYKDVIPRAKELVASSKDFKYQDQVIRDITTLANRSGITITGYTFTDGSGGPASGAAASPAPAAGGPAGSAAGGAAASPAAKKVTMTITMKSPIAYDSYLLFLRRIELNVMRLQVTGINLSPDPGNKANIINPSVGIVIFVKG